MVDLDIIMKMAALSRKWKHFSTPQSMEVNDFLHNFGEVKFIRNMYIYVFKIQFLVTWEFKVDVRTISRIRLFFACVHFIP